MFHILVENFVNRVSNSSTATQLLEWSSFLMPELARSPNSLTFSFISRESMWGKHLQNLLQNSSGNHWKRKQQLDKTTTIWHCHTCYCQKKEKEKPMMHRQAVAGQSLSIFTVGCRPSALQLMLCLPFVHENPQPENVVLAPCVQFWWAHIWSEPLYERSRDTELLISCLYRWGMLVRIAAAVGARAGNRWRFGNYRLSLPPFDMLSTLIIVALWELVLTWGFKDHSEMVFPRQTVYLKGVSVGFQMINTLVCFQWWHVMYSCVEEVLWKSKHQAGCSHSFPVLLNHFDFWNLSLLLSLLWSWWNVNWHRCLSILRKGVPC